jgi:CARDB
MRSISRSFNLLKMWIKSLPLFVLCLLWVRAGAAWNVAVLNNSGSSETLFGLDARNGLVGVVSSGGSLGACAGEGDVAVEADGKVLATFVQSGGGIVRIDPSNGSQTRLSYGGLLGTSCPSLDSIAVAPSGTIYVMVREPARVVGIDPVTGSQRLVASGGSLGTCMSECDIAVDANGKILATFEHCSSAGVVRIDPATGAQTTVSTGGLLSPIPASVTVGSDGTIFVLVAGGAAERVVAINPTTGTQQLVSSGGWLGTYAGLGDITTDVDGKILATFSGGIVRIDSASGAQTRVVSDGRLGNPCSIALFPPRVSNVVACQRPGSSVVDVSCTLALSSADAATLSVAFSQDGGTTFSIAPISGALTGVGRVTGEGVHSITWDAAQTLSSGTFGANFKACVTSTVGVKQTSGRSGAFTLDLQGLNGGLSVRGRVIDARTRLGISGAVVTLAGQNRVTSGGGEFTFSSVSLSGGNTIAVTAAGYASYEGTVPRPAGATAVALPDIGLQAAATAPVVTGVRSKYEGVFLGGVSLDNDYTVNVNWNGHAPGSIEFRANGQLLPPVSATGTETVGTIDVGSVFPGALREGANLLSVVAVSVGGVRSEAFVQPVKSIPVPAWLLLRVPGVLARQLSVKVVHDLADPGYSIELKYPDGDIAASALREIPLVGKFGAEFAVGGGCEYSISSGEWQVYAGASPYGRWAGRRGVRANAQPRFYLGNREIEFGIYGFGSGTATQTEGIKLDKFGIRFTVDEFRAEILTIYLTDYVPGLQWARVLDWLEKVGADVNSIQRVRVYGLLTFDSTLYLLVDPAPVRYGGVTLGLGAGLEIAYEPDLVVAKGRVYAGGKVEGTVDWPSGQAIKVQEIKAGLYGGIEATALGFEILNEEFALLQYKWTPSSAMAKAISAGRYRTVILDGQEWVVVPVASSGLKPMPRPHLESGAEVFLASGSEVRYAGGSGALALDDFRRLGRSPVRGSVIAEGMEASESGGPLDGPEPKGLEEGTNQVDLALVQNVFPGSAPAMASKGQELMLLYVGDNGSSNALQCTDIRWTRFDGTNWSVPASVEMNTRAEFSPRVAYDGNGDAIAVWERVADPNFTNVDLTAMAAQMDVVWSKRDHTSGQWSGPQPLAGNGYLEHAPLLCGPMSNGTVVATWTANTSNLLMGTNGAGSQVLWAEWNPLSHAWSPPQTLLTNVPYRLSQSLSGVSNLAVYAWTRDMDGRVTNANDQQVFYCVWSNGVWSAARQFTSDGKGNRNVRVSVGPNGHNYMVWQSSTDLVLSRDFSTNTTVVRAESQTAGFADYAMTIGPAGNLVLLWQEMSQAGSDAHYRVLDPASAAWSEDAQLFDDLPLERSFAPVWDDVGTLTVAYNKVQIGYTNKTITLDGGGTVTITNVPQSGRVDLWVTKRQLIKDLALKAGDFTVSAENYLPGAAVTLSATLHNTGDVGVSNAVVAFYDANPASGGVLITNVAISGWLEGGATNTVSALWLVPEPAAKHVLYAVVDPDGAITEFDEANNTLWLSIGGTDLAVSLVSQLAETNGALRVIAQVQNLGAPSATNSVLAIRRAENSNAPLATAGVPLLEPGRLAQVALDLPPGTQPAGEAVYRLFADETRVVADVDTNNNTTAFAVNLWVDSDGDGIPDGWMLQYFGHADGQAGDLSRAQDDADGDGMTNLAEYLAGTSPKDANSYLRITSVAVGVTNGVQVVWGSATNKLYSVERAGALGGGGAFTDIAEHILSTPPENSYLDMTATNSAAFFYRIKVE